MRNYELIMFVCWIYDNDEGLSNAYARAWGGEV